MAKFCFNADRTDAFEFLKTFYERVDVTFELNESNPNESCIILNDIRDRDIFMNLNERLLKIKGFSQPIYIPKWKSIRHQGPYFPPVSSIAKGLILYDKKLTKQFKLLPEEENYALLYAVLIRTPDDVFIDDVFKNNFWSSFQKELGRPVPFDSLDEIDWTNVIKKYKDKSHSAPAVLRVGKKLAYGSLSTFDLDRKKLAYGSLSTFDLDRKKLAYGSLSTFDLDRKMLHGRVIVDGKTYAAMPFAVGEESIFYGDDHDDDRRGMIKRRITPADVTLNVSPQFIDDIPNARDFKDIVYQPGVKWAAKWQDPVTKKFKYMDIIFTTNYSDSELLGDSDDEVNYSDADVNIDSDDEVNYSDADVDIDDDVADAEFDDVDDVDDDIDRPMTFARQRNDLPYRRGGPRAWDVEEDDIIDFKALDEQDRKLPYSYIVSETEQWEYVHEACKSGFRVVNKLPKVSNKILEIVADAAKIALERTNVPSKLNNFVINYADKREALNF
jgi:hypothetical protein